MKKHLSDFEKRRRNRIRCRLYRLAHLEERREKERLYSRLHSAERAPYKLEWAEKHRIKTRRMARRWRKENRIRDYFIHHRYYLAHKERLIAYRRKWYFRHKDKVRKRLRLYYLKHKGYHLAYSINRKKVIRELGPFTKKQKIWRELVANFGHQCLRCHKKGTWRTLVTDHICPISKGGSNTIHNIQPLCPSCNRWKGRRIIDFRLHI